MAPPFKNNDFDGMKANTIENVKYIIDKSLWYKSLNKFDKILKSKVANHSRMWFKD